MRKSQHRKQRGWVTRRIRYQDRQSPHHRPQELTVDIPPGEPLDTHYAAAVVAVRTSLPLKNVKIIKIEG